MCASRDGDGGGYLRGSPARVQRRGALTPLLPARAAVSVSMRRTVTDAWVVAAVLLLLVGGSSCTTAAAKKETSSSPAPKRRSTDLQVLYTITGCSECTVNASQRWCPTTMRCYPAESCICDSPTPCIDLATCFYGSRPTCGECVESGGVYCLPDPAPAASLKPVSAAAAPLPSIRCYAPSAAGAAGAPAAAASVNALKQRKGPGGHSAVAVSGTAVAAAATVVGGLVSCSNVTCLGGRCVTAALDCPAEPTDFFTRSYEVVGAVVAAFLILLTVRRLRLLFSGG